MEVNQTIPSLVNGVSQQAPELRHDTTVDEMVNCSLSFTEGTRRRNPLEYVATDNSLVGHTPFIYTYERGDGTEAYVIVIIDGAWKSYDLNGVLQDSGTDAYLAIPTGAKASECFSAVTVGDTTFIVNNTVTVAESTTYTHNTTNTDLHRSHAYYWVKRTYISYGGVDNATKNTYSYTINGTTNSTKDTENGAKSDLIAANLASQQSASSSGSIVYKNTTGAWVTSDSWGNQASEGWQGVLKKLQDLPNTMGSYYGTQTLVNVTGDENNKFEGFWSWVKNQGEAWVETVAPGIKDGFQNSTMPHILERTAIGNFTFKEFDYYDRDKGDELSNSMPSFVGKQIQDIFFYRNRLGFLAEDNVIMSETGIYENFFRTTVTDLLDTDVVDVAVDTNTVANLRYAIPFNQNLLIFGSHAQYILSSDKPLTPGNASVSQTTAYAINPHVKPKQIGPNVYFALDRGPYTQVREYYNVPGSTGNEATDITSHVPTYIDHTVTALEVSDKYDMLFLNPRDTNEIYVYNQTWEGETKSQSAWHRWEINGATIFNIQVVGDTLLVMYNEGTDVKMGKISIKSEDFSSTVYTDSTGAYSSEITLNEWGFQMGGSKVDAKEGRLQIRKLTIQDREPSDQDVEVTVGPHSRVFHRHIQGGPTATIMGESQKTSIKIKSVEAKGFAIDSMNLTGRFISKSRAI
jgi:hypothetical protein